MDVVFTPLAERQIESLYNYIAARSGESLAERFVSRVVEFCKGLTTFPRRGVRRDDLLSGLRTIGFERRAPIAFMETGDTILIEGVFYGGQDFEALFRGRT